MKRWLKWAVYPLVLISIVAAIQGYYWVKATDAVNALIRLVVDDGGLQDLDDRQGIVGTRGVEIQLDGDDVQLDGVTIALGVVPVGQRIESVVDHVQRAAQVLLTALTTRQVGEVGGQAGVFRRNVVLVEAQTVDAETEFVAHGVHPDPERENSLCRRHLPVIFQASRERVALYENASMPGEARCSPSRSVCWL